MIQNKTKQIMIADIANSATDDLVDLLNQRVGDPADVLKVRLNQIQSTITTACVKAIEVCAEQAWRK